MTLRARPVARRRGRAGWDSGDRRNSFINLGFFVAIGLSLLILVGYAAWSWYDAHYGAAATVNGQVITKDDLVNRLKIEQFRLEYIERRINTLMAKGRIARSDGQQQIDFLNQRREQLANLTLDRLVDVSLMAKLATDNGVSVSDAEVDEQLLSEATTSEQRHVWMIEIEPKVSPDSGEVEEEQLREALGRAQRAVARLKAGESWEDVARTASDSGLAPQAGDLGWLSVDSGYDKDFMTAVFAAPLNEATAIVKGADDIYRIGRATESADKEVDADFEEQVTENGIAIADYRVAARGDVVRKKLSDKIVADLKQPAAQRHVLEILLPEPNTSQVGVEPGVKVRHILFSPNDKADGAEDIKVDDPAWTKAKAEADAAYADLKAHPEKFDALARSESDEPSAKVTGGKQPWYFPTSSVDAAFKDAIFKEGLKAGDLIAPVKSAFGWHVIQFMRDQTLGEKDWLETLKTEATDEAKFRQLAKDNSEGEGAEDGGDLGWIARGQLADDVDKAVFETAIGANSSVITISGDGSYLIRVLAEETRTPTDEQIKIFEDSGFSYWYTREKEKATIDYPLSSSTTTG
ncbi:MAG TPA: peptidylprolyl isomerase [Candidatus Limnocylindria bacterium]|nr:peptidylprolyl isomerase [Candidatus Limnocylindria bacterium]